MTGLTRRALVGGALALPPALALAAPEAGPLRRIVALEWGLGATLIALGLPPIGIAEPGLYAQWVVTPSLPVGVRDVGLRLEPNLELLAELAPDALLIGPLSEPARPVLERIAPVLRYAVFTGAREPLARIAEITRDLGRRTDRGAAAEQLLAGLEGDLSAARQALGPWAGRSLLLVQFIDERHVRVHGPGNLFDAVIQRLGLSNAWQGASDIWGLSTVGVEALAAYPEADIVVLAPTPAVAAASLAGRGLWASLPQVRAGRVIHLPAAWAFGEATAAQRFAKLLVAHLGPGGP